MQTPSVGGGGGASFRQAGQHSPGSVGTGVVPGGHDGHWGDVHSTTPNLQLQEVHLSCFQLAPCWYVVPCLVVQVGLAPASALGDVLHVGSLLQDVVSDDVHEHLVHLSSFHFSPLL